MNEKIQEQVKDIKKVFPPSDGWQDGTVNA